MARSDKAPKDGTTPELLPLVGHWSVVKIRGGEGGGVTPVMFSWGAFFILAIGDLYTD